MVNMHMHLGRQKVIAVIDVAPGGVAVSIVAPGSEGSATVLASASSALSLEPRSASEDTSFIVAQLQEAGKGALEAYARTGRPAAIDTAYIFLHAPWAETVFLRAEERYQRPVRVQSSHVSSLVKKSLEENQQARAMRIYEGSVVRVRLNGYPTAVPEGKHAEAIHISSIASSVDAGLVQSVEGALHTLFPVARIVRRTALRASISLAYNTIPSESFLIIDIGAANTHIASVHDDSLEQEVVPEGVRSILARVAAGRPAEEVLGTMRMMLKDTCSTEACEKLKAAMAAAELELVRVFGEAISKIASKRHVPNEALLVVHSDLEPWLSNFFARIDFAQFSTTTLPLAVHTPTSQGTAHVFPDGYVSNASTVAISLVNMKAA